MNGPRASDTLSLRPSVCRSPGHRPGAGKRNSENNACSFLAWTPSVRSRCGRFQLLAAPRARLLGRGPGGWRSRPARAPTTPAAARPARSPPCTSLPPLQVVGRLQQQLDVHPDGCRHPAPGGPPLPACGPPAGNTEEPPRCPDRRGSAGTARSPEPSRRRRVCLSRLAAARPRPRPLTGPRRRHPSLDRQRPCPPPACRDWGSTRGPAPEARSSRWLAGVDKARAPPPTPYWSQDSQLRLVLLPAPHWLHADCRAPLGLCGYWASTVQGMPLRPRFIGRALGNLPATMTSLLWPSGGPLSGR